MKYEQWRQLLGEKYKDRQKKLLMLNMEHGKDLIEIFKSMSQDSDLSAKQRLDAKKELEKLIKVEKISKYIEEDMRREKD